MCLNKKNMETTTDLNAKILAITLKIQQEHPALFKLLDEMPVTVPNEAEPKINAQVLKAYLDTLEKMANQQRPPGITTARPALPDVGFVQLKGKLM